MANETEEVPEKKPVPRRRIVLITIGVLIVATYVGYQFYLAWRPYEWSGTVEARTIEVGSRVGGRIKDIKVKEGDSVKEGDVLLTFEPFALPAQLLEAQAQLAQAQATLEKLKNGSRPEEIAEAKAAQETAQQAYEEALHGSRREEIQGAQARLVAAEAALKKASLDKERADQLFEKGAAAKSDRDNADIAYDSAVATRDNAKQILEELQNGARAEDIAQAASRAKQATAAAKLTEAGARVEDIKAAQATVDAAQGRVDEIKDQIDELTVRAPRAARVESLDLRPGDMVAPGATAATLLEEDQLYVRIYVPETEIGHIKVGQEVPITVDSFGNKIFEGVVEHINQDGEYSPRNLQTADERADQVFASRIGIKEGRDDLRAGMAAFIRVPQ